jgi:hypothetical protein
MRYGVALPFNLAGMTLSTHPSAVAQRIMYLLPWHIKRGERYPIITAKDGDQTPILTRRSALTITESDKPLSTEWLAGRVVMIGASFADSRDLHFTPLDRMPGNLVLINAIHSLYHHGEITPPPWYIKLLIEVLLIGIMSIATLNALQRLYRECCSICKLLLNWYNSKFLPKNPNF